MKRLLILIFLACPAFGQLWSGVLDSARATDWQNYVGIPGGIPTVTTQCGPTINAGATAATILAAWNHSGVGYTSCGSGYTYVQLGSGTFNLSAGMYCVGCNKTVLRGMGADLTHLVFSNVSTCQGGNGTCGIGTDSSDNTDPTGPGPSSVYNWTAGYTKGSTSITLSNLQNIVANSTMIFLDQCDTGFTGSPCSGTSTDNSQVFQCSDQYDSAGPTGCSIHGADGGFARLNRWQWEIVQATGCSPACGTNSAGTVTISIPLIHPNWASGQTPQAWLIQPSIGVGVEDLSLDLSATTALAGVSFKNSVNSWVRGVAVLHSFNIGIYLIQDLQTNVESNYVFDAGQSLANADPTGIKHSGASNLYANNIIEAVRPFFLPEGPESGSVVIANFGINSYTNDAFMFGGLWDGHSNGTDYNLLESNVTNQLTGDLIHGGHLFTAWYRNLAPGWESCANGQCGGNTSKNSDTTAVATQSYSRYANFIANIVGEPGFTNVYNAPQTGSSPGGCLNNGGAGGNYIFNQTIWAITCGNSGAAPALVPGDTIGQGSAMRWGNYDVVNATTRFNTGEVPSGISPYPNPVPTTTCTAVLPCPPSFYYASRPSWWAASIPFPAMGPEVTSGNVGICSGTLNVTSQFNGVATLTNAQCGGHGFSASQWGGHVNAIPAMACALNTMGMPPDGSGTAKTFSRSACYAGSAPASSPPAPATGLFAQIFPKGTQ